MRLTVRFRTRAREGWIRPDVFLAVAAFLITAAPFLASASFSKPITAEYFLPMTWATRNARLMPAPATAWVMAYPRPGRLSPSTSSVGIPEASSPPPRAAFMSVLPATGYTSMAAFPGVPWR